MFDFMRNMWNNARQSVGIVVALLLGMVILPVVMKAMFSGFTSLGLDGDWATIIIVSLVIMLGFALWGNLTGVPELARPASATWRQITRFAPWAIIVAILVFGWSKFSSDTGLGRMIDAEIRDQSAIWNTEAEITNFRADTRAHSRQVVAVRDTPVYIGTLDGKFTKTQKIIKRGEIRFVYVDDSRSVNYRPDGTPIIRYGTITLVAVREFNDEQPTPEFVSGADLAPAGHAPILEPIEKRSETVVRNSNGVREFYLDLGPGEESQTFGAPHLHTNLRGAGEKFHPWCIKELGGNKQCLTHVDDKVTIPSGRPFVVIAGDEGVRLRVTEITSR